MPNVKAGLFKNQILSGPGCKLDCCPMALAGDLAKVLLRRIFPQNNTRGALAVCYLPQRALIVLDGSKNLGAK